MNVRQCFFASAAIAVALLSGCGSSSTRDGADTPDDVPSSANDGNGSDSQGKSTAKTDQPDHDTNEMSHGAKSTHEGNSVPEDYALTDRDCVELARQYSVVQKADQMVLLDPRLTTAQKKQAETSINDAVRRLGENWEHGCRSSLVGGVVDRERLKCAMVSKTVKGFDECINAEPSK
jgi:hypothetical protein